ncbi:peptide methionine sulfoxide reductase A5 isoform X2 [Sorghum bicolor]|uniref:peptide methionine sulfoxide reductase A5 isoform X2 n=1 Tax=Sorghum bicolor TaxID=4558 RepID=UPI000B425DC9|nr:peptide methionine sulfoxide reductase A5 isoform X2 [Sorghum bicolor]|eukprot:XP_021305336.1 peptide methionine sulfoxide reductase A5 isoform X2 [Sorghum bicolor]
MAAPSAVAVAGVILIGVLVLLVAGVSGARLPGRGGAVRGATALPRGGATATAVFALGSFWRSEAAFGCLPGVIRTSVGYAGGSKANPEYRNLADHAECVKVEYDPRLIHYRQLLDVFWASHDPREVFGQGPDVGNQYRSKRHEHNSQVTGVVADLLSSLMEPLRPDWLLLAKKKNKLKIVAALLPHRSNHWGCFILLNQNIRNLN